jgi:hypothetical protein
MKDENNNLVDSVNSSYSRGPELESWLRPQVRSSVCVVSFSFLNLCKKLLEYHATLK